MKTIKVLSGIAIVAIMASFAPIGGEGFTMHVNNTLILEHYFYSKAATPRVSMDVLTDKAALSIAYNECGKIGTNRVLTLKDEAGRVLKEWRFPDTKVASLIISGNEILEYRKANKNTVSITYSSKFVSPGRVLTEFTGEKNPSVASKK